MDPRMATLMFLRAKLEIEKKHLDDVRTFLLNVMSDTLVSMVDEAMTDKPLNEGGTTATFAVAEAQGFWTQWLDSCAWLIWMYRDARSNQSNDDMLDDYMTAKRFFAYLISNRILSSLSNPSNTKCPKEILQPEYVKYILSLNISEYIQIDAFLAHKRRVYERTESAESRHFEDYLASQRALIAQISQIIHKTDRDACKLCLHEMHSVHATSLGLPVMKEEPPLFDALLRMVSMAKVHSLIRLRQRDGREDETAREYVFDVYNWLYEHDAPPPPVLRAENPLVGHESIMNVFELFLSCKAHHLALAPQPQQSRKTQRRPDGQQYPH